MGQMNRACWWRVYKAGQGGYFAYREKLPIDHPIVDESDPANYHFFQLPVGPNNNFADIGAAQTAADMLNMRDYKRLPPEPVQAEFDIELEAR